uniref:Uncharacterized protein n=1 Tax=Panagrolaimus sp. ES5 TaxID=591445 RepID=A0AC34F538_9BILA
MNCNYFYPSPYGYSSQSGSTVVRVQNQNIGSQPLSEAAAGAIGKSQRLSATWLEDFFKDFDPDLDMEFDKPAASTFGFCGNPIFRTDENNEVVQEKQKAADKKGTFLFLAIVNDYLNPSQPRHCSSRSPSLSPSLSPSDFSSSSASSSYCPQNYCFSFSPENHPPQQNNNNNSQLLYPPNQWDYSNSGNSNNNQYYPPGNTVYYGQSS